MTTTSSSVPSSNKSGKHLPKLNQTCRFYEQQYPEPNDFVIGKVTSMTEKGIFVTLPEYGNMKAFILFHERRRIYQSRSLRSACKGKLVVASVLRVDKRRGCIDLSRKNIKPEDVTKCEEWFTKSKVVHLVMRQVAGRCDIRLEVLNQQIAWPLYKQYGHALDAFKMALVDSKRAFANVTMTAQVEEQLMYAIRLRVTAIVVGALIEVTCQSIDAIDDIKTALKAGEALGSEQSPVKVMFVASPLYSIATKAATMEEGTALLEKAIKQVETTLSKHKGTVRVMQTPSLTTDKRVLKALT